MKCTESSKKFLECNESLKRATEKKYAKKILEQSTNCACITMIFR